MTNESSRHQITEAVVTVSNDEAYKKQLADAHAKINAQEKEIVALKAKVEVLKEVVSEHRGY